MHYARTTDGTCAECPANSAVTPFNVSDSFLHVGGDVSGWEGARSVTECGNFGAVLGGYNHLGRSSFLRRTYTGLCKHNRISLAFGFVAIDGWKGDIAKLFVDGVVVWSKTFSNTFVGDGGCGGPGGDAVVVEGQLVVPHRERAMTVEFRTTLADDGPVEASWGLSFFAVGALCSGDEAAAPCTVGLPPPGGYGGLVDGELALVGDSGLMTSVFADNVKQALGVSLWLLQNVADTVDIETLQTWTQQGTERLVLSEFAQNCNTACSSAGLSCSDAAFPFRVLNQDRNMVSALFSAVGVQCTQLQENQNTKSPHAYYDYSHDSEGIQTLNYIRCYFGYRIVLPGSTLQDIVPNCGAYSGSIYRRLCPCGQY